MSIRRSKRFSHHTQRHKTTNNWKQVFETVKFNSKKSQTRFRNSHQLRPQFRRNICATSIFFHLDGILVEDLQCVFDNIIFMNFSTNTTTWSSMQQNNEMNFFEYMSYYGYVVGTLLILPGLSMGCLIVYCLGPECLNYLREKYCPRTCTTPFCSMRGGYCGKASRREGRRRRVVPIHKMKIHGVLCTVCQEEIELNDICRKMPACKHIFHVECINKWMKVSKQCPNCRRSCYLK